MEKPVRIVGNDKIRTFNEKVRNGIEHALNFMMSGTKIEVGAFDPFLMPVETYLAAYKKKSVLVKIHAERQYEGELYWFFELKTAIVLGSMLRMIPVSPMSEKLNKGEFDAMDQDAFGEVGNQLSGILDRAFRTLTKKDVHLRMDFKKSVYPDESIKLESFQNKEEYVVLLCNITIPEHGTQKLTLLLPRSLYEVLLNLEVELEGITPKQVVVHSWSPARIEQMQARLNSRYVKVIPVEKADEIFNFIDKPGITAFAIDLKKLEFPLAHQDAIYLKRLSANRTFLRLPYFLTWEGAQDAGLKELEKLGLKGTTRSLEKDFPGWLQSFTKDPGKA